MDVFLLVKTLLVCGGCPLVSPVIGFFFLGFADEFTKLYKMYTSGWAFLFWFETTEILPVLWLSEAAAQGELS
ncbi:hypothetical protein [uncultured Sunxiuqinia sp.]|uniref:hypothetical protein n=1 Tax=uncultured Sunxiuqinia sp. TaxID=1573825 RepID=UPI00262F5B0E|nr:hypothetical protein [uncultured Sunxiuqinia sp.]